MRPSNGKAVSVTCTKDFSKIAAEDTQGLIIKDLLLDTSLSWKLCGGDLLMRIIVKKDQKILEEYSSSRRISFADGEGINYLSSAKYRIQSGGCTFDVEKRSKEEIQRNLGRV